MFLTKAKAVGIDPGYSGAAVYIDIKEVNNIMGKVSCSTMTVIEFKDYLYTEGKQKTKQIDFPALSYELQQMLYRCDICTVERVKAMPRDGGTSAFNFGYITGALNGIVHTFDYLLLEEQKLYKVNPTPQKWKSKLGFPTGAPKQDSIKMAELYFPKFKHNFYGPRGGIKDGVAEAALMALYGINTFMTTERMNDRYS